jgi:hypothetical protein
VDARMVEIERAVIDSEGAARLDEIRSRLKLGTDGRKAAPKAVQQSEEKALED